MSNDLTPYEAGDKIEYMLPDKNGKPHWFEGLIHGVKRFENPATNMIERITYLVDTGRDERVDEYRFDHRDREANKRINVLVKKGIPVLEAVGKVYKQPDLPDNKIDVEYVRQPEQIELPPANLRKIDG